MFGRRPARSRLATVLFAVAALVVVLGPVADAIAFDRTNIPLKNWGGFSEYRDAAYDDLERLVTAGLADRTLLNTKPLSRVEAARIVELGVQVPDGVQPPGNFSFTPIDRGQVFGGLATHSSCASS